MIIGTTGQVGPAWHYADSRARGIYLEGRGWVGGAAVLAFVHAPFHQLAGQERQSRGKQQHPSSSPCCSSICTAELDGPARMWRALLVKLFLVFMFSVRWCHSQGKLCLFFFSHLMIHGGTAELLCYW